MWQLHSRIFVLFWYIIALLKGRKGDSHISWCVCVRCYSGMYKEISVASWTCMNTLWHTFFLGLKCTNSFSADKCEFRFFRSFFLFVFCFSFHILFRFFFTSSRFSKEEDKRNTHDTQDIAWSNPCYISRTKIKEKEKKKNNIKNN